MSYGEALGDNSTCLIFLCARVITRSQSENPSQQLHEENYSFYPANTSANILQAFDEGSR